MKSVQIQLTTECNQRCFMCRKYCWETKSIDIKVLEEKIQKYKDCTFTFSGGDPLSYKNLVKLNEILSHYNIVYQVFTNLNYNLTDEQKVFLQNAKYIQVSLDGIDTATYNSVRRPIVNGQNVVIKNLINLSEENKDKIKINCTVSKRNYFDVAAIYLYCHDVLGLKVRFFPVHTDETAKLEGYMLQYIKIQLEDANLQNEDVFNIFFNATIRKPYDGKCFVKKHHRIIDEQGLEYTCCRAINDNGEDWNGKNCVENLSNIDDENILYDYCKECDRYRKFNENWNIYKDEKELFL